ncbi:kinase-like protein [Aaosphaeria arxii CBS 175.79]|uniref:Kinase-like protein n=1 Tax=Aaosphaeria arxii CBS 175.79 TaxID=1450172 RepID=A0A6A5Y8U7_9PLEO|nr:kinase-like protein [Aaosphaeria arxii CBS 175.79]KAF2021171.1 kinase-like protein [Aaosphaeria arxii CBS 175.79]
MASASTWPACDRARERLYGQRASARYYERRDSVSYFPRSGIVKVLEEFPLQLILNCDCDNCRRYSDLQGRADQREKHVDRAELLNRYATTYGLLIWLRYPSLIHLFLSYRKSLDDGIWSEGNLAFLLKSEALAPEKAKMVIGEILEGQYHFCVQKIDIRKTVSTLSGKEILPFEEEDKPRGRGDFGEVWEFKIPKEYVAEELGSRQIDRYARKIIDRRWSQDTRAEAKEWVNHLFVNDLNHPNLMEALAAFEYGNDFSMIMELAECTLWEFLKGAGDVQLSSEELWRQVVGMTEGLAYLHGASVNGGKLDGRMFHMDLKPSNVLFANKTMKIADFGLSYYKPGIRATESRISGNSRHEGAGAYAAPPSRASAAYDVYSLGTIISEIACFDVSKKEGVFAYRTKRTNDTLAEAMYEASMQFYYPRAPYNLKDSVVQEHSDLFQKAESSRANPQEEILESWQGVFYQKGVFDLIGEMLLPSAEERPEARYVASKLETYVIQASRVDRGSDPPLIDVWKATREGRGFGINAPQCLEINRLPAHLKVSHLGTEHIGLWLYPDVSDKTVEIRTFRSNGLTLDTKEITVFRRKGNPIRAIKPGYLKSRGDYPLHLLHIKDGLITYILPKVAALRFQSVLTGQYIYQSMSLKATQYAFYKKSSRIFSRQNEFIEKSVHECASHIQFWTSREIGSESRSDQPLDISLAILTEEKLVLIEVTNELRIPETRDSRMLSLENLGTRSSIDVKIFEVPEGIPLNLKFNKRSRHSSDAKFKDTSPDRVKIHLENDTDIMIFWQTLRNLQQEWMYSNGLEVRPQTGTGATHAPPQPGTVATHVV